MTGRKKKERRPWAWRARVRGAGQAPANASTDPRQATATTRPPAPPFVRPEDHDHGALCITSTQSIPGKNNPTKEISHGPTTHTTRRPPPRSPCLSSTVLASPRLPGTATSPSATLAASSSHIIRRTSFDARQSPRCTAPPPASASPLLSAAGAGAAAGSALEHAVSAAK